MSFIPPDTTEIKSVEHALSLSQAGFVEMRDRADAEFQQKGLQPSTAPQPSGESDEENVKKKRANYKWNLRANFVPQVDPSFSPSIPKEQILAPARTPTADKIPGLLALIPHFPVPTMDAIVADNRKKHEDSKKGDFYDAVNIGLRDDWYTDACFGQQQFTGVSPSTITILTNHDVYSHFKSSAHSQSNEAMELLIGTAFATKQLYVQDCSYYREALGLDPDAPIQSDIDPPNPPLPVYPGRRYGCAGIALFHLTHEGKLHPLAITLDYKGTASKRVTMFNKRFGPHDSSANEKDDWPWRYAKMCAQSSDWARHEMTVHLATTHLIEEAIIVAAQRNLPDSHVVCQIMNAHWLTTLSLNKLVYSDLIPRLIGPSAPLTLAQTYRFIVHDRNKYDFVGSYIPNDLKKRGFPLHELEIPHGKFHNYTYARQVYKMWSTIHGYVKKIIGHYYKNDAAVCADRYLKNFVNELRGGDGVSTEGGHLPQFPVLDTVPKLIDAITMCIHIAAPQHTAVNYLQQLYLSFIPNRPGSLYTPPASSLSQLKSIGEKEVMDALPLNDPFKWMLMAQVPYLLSEEVKRGESMVDYAETVAKHYNPVVAAAGEVLRRDIHELGKTFRKMSKENDDKVTEYSVLYPNLMAAAIVI